MLSTSDPKLPEGWPTLVEVDDFKSYWGHESLTWAYRMERAARFAVTAYPALVALVEERHEYRDCSAGFILDKLAAILALAKEETKG